MEKVAVYPGTFDPFTNGHKKVLIQACHVFSKVIVAIATDCYKQTLFSASERKAMIQCIVQELSGVEVEVFDGLLADFVHEKKADAVVRGLRMVSDFEYEMQMAAFLKQSCPETETVFFPAQTDCSFISASFVRNIAALGGDVTGFVPACVAAQLDEKFGLQRTEAGKE